MPKRQVPVNIEPERYQLLQRLARLRSAEEDRSVSAAELIRQAIEAVYGGQLDQLAGSSNPENSSRESSKSR